MGARCLGLGWRVLIRALPLLSLVQPTPWISSKKEVRAHHVLFVSDELCSCHLCALEGKARDLGSQLLSSSASWEKNILKTNSKALLSVNGKTQAPPDWDNSTDSSHNLPPGTPHTSSLPMAQPGMKRLCPLTHCPPGAIPVRGPDDAVNIVIHHFPETDAQARPNLGFRVHLASGAALCLVMDFGDSSGVEMRIRNLSDATVVTAYHQYGKEGIYMLKAVIYNEFHGSEVELGPYYVEISQEAVSVFMNSSSVHKDEVLVFTGSYMNQESTVVMHHFPSISSYNVSFISQTQVGDSQAWPIMTVWYKMQPISVYTNGTVFATDTDIAFEAVTKETTPLEFVWNFGDDPPLRTTSRSVKKRFSIPHWYRVTVTASNRISSVVSEPHLIRVQKKIVANRLMSTSSALVNSSVTFECRINFGTDVAYLWNFGDGTVRLGNSSTSHVYRREGEFTVEVLASNSVSAAALSKQLFIVREPCQPPLLQNTGPGMVQIWRSQPLRLGVTLEAAVLCDISRGLSYTWSLMGPDGSPVPLPASVDTHRQTLVLPSYTLESSNYTALAKVQIKGSVVHSTYHVGVDVRARAPVSVISEGTHLFIPRTTVSPIILTGSQSFDPDNAGATFRYHWECSAASSPGRPCFDDSAPHQLDAGAPTISFPAQWLSDSYDQFLVTLMVSSGGRNSSEAQVFLSTRSDPAFRFIHISWVNFKGIFVNWNEELSLQAVCEDCGETPNLSYSWDLFLVNATEKDRIEAPFCRALELLSSSGLWAAWKSAPSDPPSTELQPGHPGVMTATLSQGLSPHTLGQPAPSATGSTSMVSMVGVHQTPAAGDSAVLGEAHTEGPPEPELGLWSEGSLMTGFSESSWPPHDPSPPLSDFEAYYSDIQEAVPAKGRQPGNSTSLPGSEPGARAEESPGDGDNLLGPFLSAGRAVPTLLIDWPKALVSRAVFQGYTSSGITERAVTIKPYSLSSGETYVLQASVASKHSLLGKAQLYLKVTQAPQDMACQVQPHRGVEAHTIFSVFCMSGKPDFHYEFSYWTGNASKHTLYQGRDAQYYFALPAGEPLDGYRVMVSIEITNGEGSKVQPCTVEVTVLPRYHGSDCLDEELYNSSLKNLSTLQLIGSYMEVRNYITMMTRILSRLAEEDRSASCGQWSRMQDALISSVCKLAFADQEEMVDSVLMLKDLIRFPNKLSFVSAVLILKYARTLLAQGQFLGSFVVDRRLRLELTCLISGVWEASEQEKSRNEDYLQEQGIKLISDSLLGCLSLSHERQLHVSTEWMEIWILLHHNHQNSMQTLGPIQVGGVVGLTLYNCSSRRPINRQRLRRPVTVEFGEEDSPDNRRNETTFVLLRDKVNFHQFIELSENPRESLQIRIEFTKPFARAFPIMLLVRFSEKPTPSDFLVKQICFWDEHIVQMYVPAVSQKDAKVGYLSLLDADYDRKPSNKYLAKAVNYTVQFQWIRCLFWDKQEWKSESFSPQPGTSPEKINCSYDRLATFSVLRRELNASFEVSDISQFQSHPQNLLPGIFIVFFMILYGFLAMKSKRIDHHEKKKTGYIFLEEDPPADHQLYAVVIDTGFRALAQLSSKVYIVLCGENGLSETKELHCPEKPLFERNSRHTFILSAPDQLGPLRKIRVWHDSRGPSPGWFLSHVMVKELRTGQGWFFPAQCWLAAGRQDGRVERELTCLRRGLGFWKLFYSKFTEYLEDFHVWLSVYSRPSPSGYLLTQRLALSFSLLCVYACLAAAVTAGTPEQGEVIGAIGSLQLPLDVGPTNVTPGSFGVGLLCTLLASPGAQLLSLLFRLSKDTLGPSGAEPRCPLCGAQITQAPSGVFEGLMSWWLQACLRWSGSAAWALCGMTSLAGGLGTGVLGYRFGPAQCVQWLHLLFLSVLCCVLVTQPLMICLTALGFAWKRRDDSHFFVESLCAATRNLDPELEERSRAHGPPSSSCHLPDWAVDAEKVLAARQRARHLRWARPPSTALLRVTGERMRRERRTRAALRDITTYTLMLLLLLFMIYGKFSQDEHSLNQAIRKEFIRYPILKRQQLLRVWHLPAFQREELRPRRENGLHRIQDRASSFHWLSRNARNPLGGLRSTDDWWQWSLTTLLDGLYPQGSSMAQPGALGGKCYLIGSAVIKQLKVSPGSSCKPPRPFSASIEDPLSTRSPEVGGPENPYMIDTENQNMTPSGLGGCRARGDCVLSLGRTRTEAHMALTGLRASKWIDCSTRAVSVHFSLYNAPTRLFTSVSLSVEIVPTGGLVPSSLVESFSIFRSHAAWRYHLVLPELSVAGVSLAHHAASGHLATLAVDVVDQFHRGLSHVFMDLSLMASWNQRVRWLQGILSSLLVLKCLYLLGIQKAMASCAAVVCRSLCRVFAPALAGALMLAAHYHLCWLMLCTQARPSGSLAGSCPVLLFRFLGRSHQDSFLSLSKSDQQATTCYCGALFLVMATLYFQMLRGSLMTFPRRRKLFHSKSLVRLKDVRAYMWGKVLAFLGQETPWLEEAEVVENHKYYLDEFANLLDELLMKINGLSDSLQLPLLEKQSSSIGEARAEDPPLVGTSGYQATEAQF